MCTLCRPAWFVPVALLLAVSRLAAADEPLAKVELSKRGKEASALLEVRPGTRYAAAFGVHPSGLFVTTEEAIRDRGDAETVTLVFQPGARTQKVLKARVIRTDADLNLALLRVEGADRWPVLALGSTDDLTELMELVVFGFPFRTDLAEGEYPALNVKLGRISTLRRKGGELVRIRLDTGLAPGFTGGAALDGRGKAAGVIVAGGTEENTYVIPANVLAGFLARPDVRFQPPTVTAADRGRPHRFEVRAVSVLPSPEPFEVELTLRGEDGKDRKYPLEPADGLFSVRAVPEPAGTGPALLQTSITFPDGAVAGAVADQQFSVAGTPLRLSQVRSIRFGAKGQVLLTNGKVLEGPLAGLDALGVQLDEAPVRVNLAEAVEARIEAPPQGKGVAYTVVVRRAGKEVARLSGRLGGTDSVPVLSDYGAGTGIRPAVLPHEQVVKSLPGVVGDMCVGGAGRFLILHLPQQRQLAVFDASEARVVKFLPAPEDKLRIAAGRDKLIVALPAAKVIQRWSLTTFQREVTVPLPIQYALTGLALGSASDGPLLVQSVDNPRTGERFFIDLKTMKKLDIKEGRKLNVPIAPQVRLRASADGSVFTGGTESYFLSGATLDAYSVSATGDLLPSPDGRTLYCTGQMFTAEAKPLGANGAAFRHGVWYVPALHGPYYLSLNQAPQAGAGPSLPSLEVHMAGDSRPLATLLKLDALDGLVDAARATPPALDRHVFLIPDAKLLVILPMSQDRLVLQHFDLEQMLAQAGMDYLFVISRPPTQFRPGTAWSYRLAVRSKKGGVKVKLESGPPGMVVSPAGLLRWAVPSNFSEPEVDVLLTVSDASGQEAFHTFKLTNTERPTAASSPAIPGAPPAVPPTPTGELLVRLPPTPLPIKPAPLKTDKVTLPLPGAIRDVCAGGGGRLLFLHLPQQRRFAVFDANEARVVKYLPAADDNVVFAAGMDKLVMVFPNRGLIQRWSLTTLEREVIAPAPVAGQVTTAAMGHASAGPLVLIGPRQRGPGGHPFRLVDIQTLKELVPAGGGGQGMMVGVHPQYPGTIRASADGHVLGMWNPGMGPSGLQTVVLSGRGAQGRYEHLSVGHVVPGPDGRVIFTGAGLYTPELKRLDGGAPNQTGPFTLPALHGGFYLSVANPTGNASVSVHLTGDSRTLVTLTDVDGLSGPGGPPGGGNRGTLGLDKRLFLIPQAQLIVTLPPAGDKLHLYRFDLDRALDKAGIDYLLVTSSPKTQAVKGRTYTYPLVVKSKKGGVKYKVESGPDGMKVSPDGRLTWPVPADFGQAELDVIVTVSDASGQEIFHTFKIAVADKGAAVPPPP